MAISGDYPSPVTVNGYSCRNCTDVGRAEKHIDPAHPADGPFGVNADKNSPEARQKQAKQIFDREKIDAAVATQAALAHVGAGQGATPTGIAAYHSAGQVPPTGQLVNLSA